jgi:hypothetical protein
MQLTLGAFTPPFPTLSLEFIDRTLDHRQIGKKGLGKLPYLIAELNKGLPKAAKFLFIHKLYAYYYISIQITTQNARKK